MATIAEQLAAASVIDDLKHGTLPSTFTKIPFANNSGYWSEAGGWFPEGYIESLVAGVNSGIYYNASKVSGGNAYCLATHASGSDPAARQQGAWLFMAPGATPTGYQALIVGVSGTSHTAVIREWKAGALVAEASKAITIPTNVFGYACVVMQGQVSVWVETGSGWEKAAEFASGNLSEGNSALDGNGSNPFIVNFATGTLLPELTNPLKGANRSERHTFDPVGVSLRHIKKGTSSSPGAKKIIDVYYYPDPIGLNGRQGFQGGSYERKLNEEGSFSLKFANAAGQDGALHRERFAVIADDDFRPGDEFIEIWRGNELLFVGLPVSYELGFADITITGYSAFWLLKKTRETATGYWVNAPRDVMEHYLSVWQAIRGTDFDGWNVAYSHGYQTTSDGLWEYVNSESSPDGSKLIMAPNKLGGGQVCVVGGDNLSFGPTYGTGGNTPHRCIRVEARLKLTGFKPDAEMTPIIYMGLDSSETIMSLEPTGIRCFIEWAEGGGNVFVKSAIDENGTYHLAIERRDRWVYFFVNGALVATIKGSTKSLNLSPNLVVRNSAYKAEVSLLLLRIQRPFLSNPNQPGDYVLPGAPTPGGLEGHYHLDQDIWASTDPTAIKIGKVLHPSREVDPASSETGGIYQRRIDSIISFPTGAPPAWQPAGAPNGESFSCRWVGAIYLALDEFDYALRATSDDRCRVWIAKTRLNEEYINDWTEAGHGMLTTTGPWLKAGSEAAKAPSGSTGQLAGMKSGWYPIVIEFSQGGGAAGCIVEYTRSEAPGTWQYLGAGPGSSFGLPADKVLKLSPLGLYQDNIQFESHYEAFQKIAAAFGYQWVETPQSLESGNFPGYVAPAARIGRDTEYVLDSIEATQVGNRGNADDVADAILAEAQGLGDPSQNTQLTIEVFNLPSIGDLYMAQEQESLSDLNLEALVLQRARSLLALHLTPWEEIGAQPQGKRSLVDKFPLSGELAEFKWEPGDGIRLDFPQVNVVDENPRQIQGISWPIVPDGIGVPTASFKQRPRNFKETLRTMLRGSIASQRNYQGQLVKVTGQLGGNTGAQDSDQYSRCSLPTDVSRVVSATLVVQYKTDASAWTIEVNGSNTGVKFTTSGRYDITPWVRRDASNPRCYARGVGGTGAVEVVVELLILR